MQESFIDTIGIPEKTIEIMIQIGIAAIVFFIGWIAIRIILRIEKKALEKFHLDEALHLFIIKATKVILWIILVITVLQKLGVSTTSLITVLGAGGAAIALALKDSLGNIAGGLIILINKPFSRGDTIEVADAVGIVDSIDLLTTQLHTFDNKVVTVPNGTIITSVLTNYSREDTRRVDCVFSISYSADIEQARTLMENVADSCEYILAEPEPLIGVASHGEHAVLMDFRVWCRTEHYYDVKYFLEENVKLAFDEAGINIPYPQLDVHISKK